MRLSILISQLTLENIYVQDLMVEQCSFIAKLPLAVENNAGIQDFGECVGTD